MSTQQNYMWDSGPPQTNTYPSYGSQYGYATQSGPHSQSYGAPEWQSHSNYLSGSNYQQWPQQNYQMNPQYAMQSEPTHYMQPGSNQFMQPEPNQQWDQFQQQWPRQNYSYPPQHSMQPEKPSLEDALRDLQASMARISAKIYDLSETLDDISSIQSEGAEQQEMHTSQQEEVNGVDAWKNEDEEVTPNEVETEVEYTHIDEPTLEENIEDELEEVETEVEYVPIDEPPMEEEGEEITDILPESICIFDSPTPSPSSLSIIVETVAITCFETPSVIHDHQVVRGGEETTVVFPESENKNEKNEFAPKKTRLLEDDLGVLEEAGEILQHHPPKKYDPGIFKFNFSLGEDKRRVDEMICEVEVNYFPCSIIVFYHDAINPLAEMVFLQRYSSIFLHVHMKNKEYSRAKTSVGVMKLLVYVSGNEPLPPNIELKGLSKQWKYVYIERETAIESHSIAREEARERHEIERFKERANSWPHPPPHR